MAKQTVYRQSVLEPDADWFLTGDAGFVRFTAPVTLRSLTIIRGQAVFQDEVEIERLTVIDGRWVEDPAVNDHAVIFRGGSGHVGQISTIECGGHCIDLVGGTHDLTIDHWYGVQRPTDTGLRPRGWPTDKNWPIHVDGIYASMAHDVSIGFAAYTNVYKGSGNAAVWLSGKCSDIVLEGGRLRHPMHGLHMRDAVRCGSRATTWGAKYPWKEDDGVREPINEANVTYVVEAP
jgi:hypothetical protein